MFLDTCFSQDAAGEELRPAVDFFCDGVRADGHTAARSVQDCRLQNRGEAHAGEVDTPRFAGNNSHEFLGMLMVARHVIVGQYEEHM